MEIETDAPRAPDGQRAFRGLAIAQGAVYVATGLWPLVSMKTFLAATGPKRDLWLVKTVGLLVTVIGGVVALAGVRGRRTPEIPLLGGGSAAALAGIDLVYGGSGRIPRRYLLDAAMELAFAGGWLFVATRGQQA
jgi:hypothetical protein